jgi:hypothetical protein
LTYKSSLLVLTLGILSTFAIWNDNNAILAYGQEQEQEAPPTTTTTTPTIKITSPTKGEQVPPGELTITGISSDNASSDCTVYLDWNDQNPYQKAIATGAGGENDYSTWSFTYTPNYYTITNGTNNLTSKLSCLDNSNQSINLTKYYSVNVTGVGIGQGQQQQQQIQSPTSEEEGGGGTTTATQSSEISVNDDGNTPFTLPLPSQNPDIDNDQSLESQGGGGGGGVTTTNKQNNDNVNPNDDDEPIIYWDLD